jgi:amidophosphoribosyltransferase
MRVSSPPTVHSCFYGIDTPKRGELIAAQFAIAEMTRKIDVDSLAYLSIDGLYRALGEARRDAGLPQFCDACFTGEYPIPLTDHDGGSSERQLSLLAAEN